MAWNDVDYSNKFAPLTGCILVCLCASGVNVLEQQVMGE